MTTPTIVAVTWEDAHDPDVSPWVDNSNHAYFKKMFITVGFLLYDGTDGITLSNTYSEDMVAARNFIPRGMVHSVIPLTELKTKRTRK